MSVETIQDPATAAAKPATPYELIGGATTLRRLVDRFYDHMAEADEASDVRAMHDADLSPMRAKLFDFLSGWLGGPPLYFQRPDRKCMGSAHSAFAIGEAERDQWMWCMRQAMSDVGIAPDLRDAIDKALFRMADLMRNR